MGPSASASASAAASSNYEYSSVGKFRTRRPAHSTPYDRPSAGNSGLLSKLRNFGARHFFASNRRLHHKEEEHERRNGHQETALDTKIDPEVQEPVADLCGTSTPNNGTSGILELEQLLKQKTFTRSEIDRLTRLLKSRAIYLPVKDDRHAVELNPSVQDNGKLQEFPITSIVNKDESLGAHVSVPDNAAAVTGEQNMQHFEDQIASPAQLAKAYMSSRPATISPSRFGSHAQITWEDSLPPSNSPYTSKSRPSLLPMKTPGYSGVPENGFTTPRIRGRSAIYNMARTPYSRFLPVTHQKVSGSKNYGDSRPSLLASRSALENDGQVTLKATALKRRSTVLDEDIGSIGPIRRIRQKHNLLPLGKSGKGLDSDVTHSPKRPFMGSVDTRGASTSSASYSHVPRESSEMAAKILEHLEKMTPKEKSVESKLAAAREGSTFKLSPHMLHGQALKSMEDLDASKFLTNSHKDPKLVDQAVSHLPDPHEFIIQKQFRVEEQGPVKSVHPEDKLTPDRIIQGTDNSSLRNGAMMSISSQSVEKKQPFKMSAHEDWIELDDDCYEHKPELPGKGVEEPLRDGKSALNEGKTLDKSPVSLERTPATPLMNRSHLEGGNGMAGEIKTGFNFSTSFTPNTSSQKVFSQSTTVSESPVLCNPGIPTTRKNPTSVESNVETSSSLSNVFSGTTNAVVGVTESGTSDNKNPEPDNFVNGSLGKPLSPAVNPVVTNNVISADTCSSTLATNGGPLSSSASLSFSSSAPSSVTLANHSLSNMASSAGATTSASALSDSFLVPPIGTSSCFSENVSDDRVSKKLFSPPSKIESREANDVNVGKVNGLGNLTNSSTVTTFSGTTNGSSIFSFGTSSSSAVNSQWPNSTNGTSAPNESPVTGPGSGNVSLSTPAHFGSSSSATSFGLSGASPFASSSIFNSSVPTTKSEGTTQSSVSASVSNPVNSINGTAPIFNFGAGVSSSSEVNPFGSKTTSSLGVFQFGASSTTPTSSISSPSSSIFSSNPTGVFNFGAGSSSAATSVTNTSGGIKFGGGTSVSTSSTTPVTSGSTSPAIFSFVASAQAPSSDSNGANSSSFASSLQAPISIFGSSFSMPSSSAGFSFGGSSPAFGTSNSSMVFGSTTGVSSNPTLGFSTAASSPLPSAGTQNVFGNSASPFSTAAGNNHQMGSEDCMAEDPMQSAPVAPVFGQSLTSPSLPGFMFGSTAPSPVAPFQFPSQQNQVGPQNPSPFQASGSLEFNAGGSFSLGSGGGGDKSARKIVKVNRARNRKMR